jgi:hypothetical protein
MQALFRIADNMIYQKRLVCVGTTHVSFARRYNSSVPSTKSVVNIWFDGWKYFQTKCLPLNIKEKMVGR